MSLSFPGREHSPRTVENLADAAMRPVLVERTGGGRGRLPHILSGIVVSFLMAAAWAQSDPVSDAVDALRRGDAAAAEQILRAAIHTHPNNPDALGVLAVVLDQQKKYADADGLYRRAIALTPRSAPLLNNYGNHLLATGKLDVARGVFLKVLAIDATHANALLQLSRLAVERKAPAEALQYLDRLPAAARQQRDVEITRMQALFGVRRDGEAEELLDRLSKKAGSDPQDNFALGAALAAAGKYDKAEERFSRALEAAPDNFDVLYRLGLAASHAGHNERARDILQSAHQRQPENVDVLYDLAAVNAKLGQQETAVQLLAEAARLAPDRPDVQQLLARTTADLGYFGDALRAWDRYLKLVPKDDVARRERAFAASAMGEDMDRALADLKDYAARHASDPVGHYELGIAEASVAPEDAVRQFDRALALRPELTAARIARGLVLFKQGSFAAALPDFEAAAKQEPNNAVVLDRLGQTYMALDRSADAVPILRKAAELAPRDSKTLMHLGRALTNTGQEDEAKTIFARFRELGADQSALPHPAGLVDFLSLSSQEQMARYRAGVERTVKSDPRNPEAQVRYLKLLLDDGKTAEASTVAHRILELGPSAELLADAGNAMLAAEQYGLAKELLQKAASSDPAVTLNLAIAVAHAENPRAGLEQLDRVPPAQRSGDYYLARAQMLDASGRADDAIAALRQALHANPTRADLYRQAAAFLMQRNQPAEALAVLERGVTATHGNPDVLLMRVIALEASGKPHDAEQGLKTLGDRWPDWYNVWLARAIFAAWQGRDDEARQMLQTAAALGAAGAGQRFSAATGGAAGSDNAARAARLLQALFP